MWCSSAYLVFISSVAGAVLPVSSAREDLRLPFSTSGRDVVDNSGTVFFMTGVNWPAHQEAMIPEGLQYSSIKDIVAWAPRLGVNTIRLTYATKMIDDICANDPNQSLEKSLIDGLGQENGTKILGDILRNNPQFSKDTTRLEIFDAAAQEMAAQGVLLHLDNHMSEATWCCSLNDGNGWFGEEMFDVDKWIRGWSWIAKHAAENWPTFVGAGLRNELRDTNGTALPIDWYTWYEKMTAAANAVHKSAPDALIFFSGLDFDTWIDPIPLGQTLNGTIGTSTEGKTALFDPANFDYRNKIVLEIHKYDNEETQDTCPVFIEKWYEKGFQCLNEADERTKFLFPMILSEWGFLQDGAYWNETTYNRCTIEMVQKYKFGWMQWALPGSYYIRQGIQNYDETWGKYLEA
ncbi:Hypothetical protein D9617_39g039100 [Elsinoe fawcettii]|nr:Hypothetical protein D9617_39g039100 [Elsinoe fawcettii]